MHEFLDTVSRFCHLVLYTNAQKEYVDQVIKKIDPEGAYFADRVLTAEDVEVR